MKNVATARSFDALTVVSAKDKDRRFNIGSRPVVVADADADAYAAQGEAAGVPLVVTDAPKDAKATEVKTFGPGEPAAGPSGVADPAESTQAPQVDLSAGVAAQTGVGAPVSTLTETGTPAGNTQEA